jgi:hypothetical protein
MTHPGDAPHSKAPLAGNLKYYGGHVLSNVKIVPVYWGTGTVQVPSEMRGFYTAVVNHPHMDWLSEYDTNVKAVDGSTGTNQHIGRGTVDAKDYTITPSITFKNISDTGAFISSSPSTQLHSVEGDRLRWRTARPEPVEGPVLASEEGPRGPTS